MNATMKRRLMVLVPALAVLFAVVVLAGCGGGGGIEGKWYGTRDDGGEHSETSTLEINRDGTWLFTGDDGVTGSGEWNETDSGTYVLTAMNGLISVPLRLDGSGDGRVLSFAGSDPSRGNAPSISESTFYATEAARDAASK